MFEGRRRRGLDESGIAQGVGKPHAGASNQHQFRQMVGMATQHGAPQGLG